MSFLKYKSPTHQPSLAFLTLPRDELVNLLAEVVLTFGLHRDGLHLNFFAQFDRAVVQREQVVWDGSVVIFVDLGLFVHAQFAEDLTADGLDPLFLDHLQV